MKDKYSDRLGEIQLMHCGDYAKIIEYNSSLDVVVQFQDEHGYICHVEYWNFKKGHVKNPYHKNKYGGYVGEGKYKSTENRKGTYIYNAWIRMLERSKNKKFKEKFPAYKDVDCCDEWLCFQNFAEWYEENYYEVNGQSMEVDKDWLHQGNKIYCPEFCSVVPSIINSCLLTHEKTKGNLPIGISKTTGNKYKARISIEGKRKDLGVYVDLIDALNAYKKAKIDYVKYLANKYRGVLPKKVYNQMIHFDKRFEVEFPEYAAIH